MKVLAAERPSGSPLAAGRLERIGDQDWLIVTINGKVPSDLASQAQRHPVAALLTHPNPHVLKEALAKGVQAVVDARAGVANDRLRAALGLAATYGFHIDPSLQCMAWRPRGSAGLLTERQHEVLELYAHGLQQGEIAQRLRIEQSTVGDHYRAIRERLDVDTMAMAVEAAHERELL